MYSLLLMTICIGLYLLDIIYLYIIKMKSQLHQQVGKSVKVKKYKQKTKNV